MEKAQAFAWAFFCAFFLLLPVSFVALAIMLVQSMLNTNHQHHVQVQ